MRRPSRRPARRSTGTGSRPRGGWTVDGHRPRPGDPHRGLRRGPGRARPTTTCSSARRSPACRSTTRDDGNTKGPTEINGEAVDPLIGWCLTYLFNFTGHPAASVPAGSTRAACRSACRSSAGAKPTPTCSPRARRSSGCGRGGKLSGAGGPAAFGLNRHCAQAAPPPFPDPARFCCSWQRRRRGQLLFGWVRH